MEKKIKREELGGFRQTFLPRGKEVFL